MQTAPRGCAPKISQQLCVSAGATYLGKILLKQEWGVTATLQPFSFLTGQFRRARVTTRRDPAGPSTLWLWTGSDIAATVCVQAFGCVHTPAERIQSHCASLRLHFGPLTDLYNLPAALSDMNPNLSSATHSECTVWVTSIVSVKS